MDGGRSNMFFSVVGMSVVVNEEDIILWVYVEDMMKRTIWYDQDQDIFRS